jgi:hypothetical protein
MKSATWSSAIIVALLPQLLHAQAPRVRDSAGVRIIENGSRTTAPRAFRLAEKARDDIGGLKDNPDDELSVHNAYFGEVRLTNGTHVAMDATRLRFFDAAGKQVRVVGREGHGPHEFTQVVSLCQTRGDTLVASDSRNTRMEVLDRDGTFVREFQVGVTDYVTDACFADGTFLVREYHREAGAGSPMHLVRRRLDGAVANVLGDFAVPQFSMFLLSEASVTVSGNEFAEADPARSQVAVYDTAGKLVRIVRTADPVARITATEASEMKPLAYGMGPGARPTSDFPKPETWPAFRAVKSDPSGRLWIEDYPRRRTDPQVWTGFDRTGRMLGNVIFPAAVNRGDPRVIAFTADGVVMVREDADGARHLSTYLLVPVRP